MAEGGPKIASGAVLGPLWPSWGIFRLGESLGAVLETSWAILGQSWGRLGVVLGGLGVEYNII